MSRSAAITLPALGRSSSAHEHSDFTRPLSTPRKILEHLPQLDGVRGFAFVVVLATHLYPWPNMVGGQVAMDVFLGLSGFLITAVLLSGRASSGRVSLTRFYIRRALRLIPALLFFLFIWLAVVALFGQNNWISTVPGNSVGGPESMGVALQGVGAAVGYMTNWFMIYHWFGGYIPLGHLWSLAVEEQFYIVWAPVLAFLLVRRKNIALVVTLILAVGSLIEPLILWNAGQGGNRIFFGTDTRAGALLTGALLAQLWSRGILAKYFRGIHGGLLLASTAGLLVLSGFWMFESGNESHWYGGWVIGSVAGALVVAILVERSHGIAARMLSLGPITYVGRRSYALYLWHYAWVTWLHDLGTHGYPFVIAFSFASAELSWRLVEEPALSLKKRFSAVTADH